MVQMEGNGNLQRVIIVVIRGIEIMLLIELLSQQLNGESSYVKC